jgi:hypothetical protein
MFLAGRRLKTSGPFTWGHDQRPQRCQLCFYPPHTRRLLWHYGSTTFRHCGVELIVSLGAKTFWHKTSEQRPRVEPRPYSLIGTGREGRCSQHTDDDLVHDRSVVAARPQKSSRATLADASVSVNLNYVKTLSRDSSFWLPSLTSLRGRCHSQQYPALLFFEDTKERNYSRESARRATEDSQNFGIIQESKPRIWSFVGPHALASCVGCNLETVPA